MKNEHKLIVLLPLNQQYLYKYMTLSHYPEKSISYLYEVSIQGGVRRAADALGINASVISRQIAALERRLHLPLLEKRGRNVILTEAGKLLVDDYAKTSLQRKQLDRQLNNLLHMRGGSITLRVGQGMAEEVIKFVIKEFSQAYPDVFIHITSGDMQSTIHQIAQGEVDMAISFGPSGPPGFKCLSFSRGPICAIVQPEHPIAQLRQVSVAELNQYRLIGMNDSFGLQHYINLIFKSENLSFQPSYSCNLFSNAITLCQTGLGVAFMTEKSVTSFLKQKTLVAIPIDHRIARDSFGYLLRSMDHRLTPAGHYLWQLLENLFKNTM